MKYKTLTELKAAYDSGELSRQASPMTLDDDRTSVYAEVAAGDYHSVFNGGTPKQLLEQALDLLGIPWESA